MRWARLFLAALCTARARRLLRLAEHWQATADRLRNGIGTAR